MPLDWVRCLLWALKCPQASVSHDSHFIVQTLTVPGPEARACVCVCVCVCVHVHTCTCVWCVCVVCMFVCIRVFPVMIPKFRITSDK